MPKKPTKANIKSAAELTIKYEGSVEAAIASYRRARQIAEEKEATGAVRTFDRLIKYCEER